MKKILLLTVSLTLALSLGVGVGAQVEELPNPGITPDSFLYVFDIWGEKIGMFFTFGAEAKAKKALVYAEERLAEVKAMVEKNKPGAVGIAAKGYEGYVAFAQGKIEEAKQKGKDIEEISEKVAEAIGKHLLVLEEVLERVPEAAKEAIVRAKEVSMAGQKNALRVLATENPEKATEINLKAVEARLNRANAKAEEGNTGAAEEAIKEFENQYKFGEEISKIAQGLGKDTTTVEQLVGKATSIHLKILADIYEKVPEQAKSAIEEAMNISVEGHGKVVETLQQKGALDEVPEEVPLPGQVPEEVKERIEEKIKELGMPELPEIPELPETPAVPGL